MNLYMHHTRASGLAEVLLMTHTDHVFHEALVEPGTIAKSSSRTAFSGENELALLSVFPNPTSRSLFIELNVITETRADVFNAEGKLVKSIILLPNRAVHEMETLDLSDGVYLLNAGTQSASFQVKKQ